MRYFVESEVDCNHCGEAVFDQEFMSFMDALRERVGEPLIITSWYRCEVYDRRLGGGRSAGNHTTGRAADIYCEASHLRWKIVAAATALGAKRIGLAKNFIHVDLVEGKPQEVIWLY